MMRRVFILFSVLLAVGLLVLVVSVSQAQGPEPWREVSVQAAVGTTFTYQGRLQKDGNPVNSTCDFQFALFDAASGGSQWGRP
jgi:hypothetical protein